MLFLVDFFAASIFITTFASKILQKTHKNEVNESIWYCFNTSNDRELFVMCMFPKYLYMDNKLQAEFTSAAFLVWLGAKKTLQ